MQLIINSLEGVHIHTHTHTHTNFSDKAILRNKVHWCLSKGDRPAYAWFDELNANKN